jgi:MoaA/NifB/PqqE/SkfB family radical SAM enzyme
MQMELPEFPAVIYLGITDKCNANCVMCWRRAKSGPFLDMDMALIEKLYPALEHAKEIGWWGDGELFAHSDVDALLAVMRDLPDAKHSFSTNGKLLARYAVQLSEVNLGKVQISIDGATPGTLARIRVGVELWQIENGVRALHKAFDKADRDMPELTFIFVSMMSNIAELPLMVELADELGVSTLYVNPLNPHHSNLEAECLALVAPGLEQQYFDRAKGLADDMGLKLVHCNPLVMENGNDRPNLRSALD